ncbi:BTAD domain-containing putative transcriptional regulator [Actinocrispum wychmicini]|uniref:Putative ATPase n=1 Tax=Actinocrispum wychmicini TaxID=1213861 RepID=A0A4R2IYE6_9PSEU|nr:BTAD domain-containing putative transcriptional regulator [Actinocrispum wychmicini]TCO50893.1 putative ATPase [Actinocrispum wychmicini]
MTVELVLLARASHRGREITGARLCGLLALLANDLRAGCSAARLMEALWPEERPEHPTKALQVLVSRARARLGSDVIASTPNGYRLTLHEDEIDASAVMLSASASEDRARAGDHAAAFQHAKEGLKLCEGAEWPTSTDGPLSELRAARFPAYRSLVRAHALALSRLGRPGEALEQLADLVTKRPRDEEVLAELLRSEAATIGPAAALARYDAYRRALRDELGSDPGTALQNLHQELLRGTAPATRQGVRHEPNPLLGRDDDIAAVSALLRTSRVTSIVGAGGLGKTRLAHAVSRQAEQRVVHFVGLAGVTVGGDVVGEVASALGIGEAGHSRSLAPTDVLANIVTALGRGLLVLDNCEHVVGAAADLVHTLVSMSKDLRVLTTSRAPLGLSSESVYLLPELDLSTTVELFGQRAQAARPDVDLPADTVRELCGHLDGLPLAVELAAARVRVMTVNEIARRLDDRFALLRGGTRDAPQRHRTLHAVIDWSWHLLEPAGQAAMRALSVFPGGFTVVAAEHVIGDEALEVLEQLVDQSLLKVVDTESGTRFRMLETVREFSAASRENAGETDAVVGRFVAWARDFGVARPESIFGADLVVFAEQARAEQDNLVQALRHGLDRADGPAVAAISSVLGGLWMIESNFTRLATLTQDAAWLLSHYRPEPALVETTRTALVLCAMSGLLAGGSLRSMVALRRLPAAPPDTLTRAAQIVLGTATDPAALLKLCDSDELLVAGMANYAASYVWESDNDLVSALSAARQMLTAVEKYATPWISAVAHGRIGELCLQLDPGDEVLRHVHLALAAVGRLGAVTTAARVRWVLVLAHLQRGDVEEAEQWLQEVARNGGIDTAGMEMLDVVVNAEILRARGDVDGCLRLWRQVVDGLQDNVTSWGLEVRAVTVVSHAYYGRLDLVTGITDALQEMIASRTGRPSDFPSCGALLLALATVDIAAGRTRQGARMVALADRMHYLRTFQPAMSATRAKQIAEEADKTAYEDAVSSYAALDNHGLRAAVLAVTKPGRV